MTLFSSQCSTKKDRCCGLRLTDLLQSSLCLLKDSDFFCFSSSLGLFTKSGVLLFPALQESQTVVNTIESILTILLVCIIKCVSKQFDQSFSVSRIADCRCQFCYGSLP